MTRTHHTSLVVAGFLIIASYILVLVLMRVAYLRGFLLPCEVCQLNNDCFMLIFLTFGIILRHFTTSNTVACGDIIFKKRFSLQIVVRES